MTRVLHVSDCYAPRLGGIELHVRDLVEHQRARGDDARVLTRTPAGPIDITGRTAQSRPDPAWLTRATDGPGLALGGWWRRIAEELDAVRPDVVHVHVSVWSPLSTLAARVAVTRGYPVLATIHSMWSRLGPLPTTARVLMSLRRWPIQWSAVSDPAAEPLREMLGPGHEVAVLPNAVEEDYWREGAEPTPPDVVTLVSVLRYTRTKRALPLVRALREVRTEVDPAVPLRAVLVGEGPLLATVRTYLDRHDMSDWVHLPGRLERHEVRSVLAGSSVYVSPARLESFGIAALEARSLGLPVVAMAESGVSDFIVPGRHGLLARDDEELADQLVRLVGDEALRTRIADHNRRESPGLSWERALERTDVLYAQAALRAGRPAAEPAVAGVAGAGTPPDAGPLPLGRRAAV